MENREAGKTMILCTEGDALVGNIYVARSVDEDERMMAEIANGRTISVRVPGHSIYITPAATISGRRLETDYAVSILREMAAFYLRDKIAHRPGNYSRWRDSGEQWSREQAPLEVERLIEKFNKSF